MSNMNQKVALLTFTLKNNETGQLESRVLECNPSELSNLISRLERAEETLEGLI